MDLIQQGTEIARRRKLAEALQQQSLEQGNAAAAGKGNVMDVLNSFLGEREAANKLKALAGEDSDYRAQYADALRRETNSYLDTANGTPDNVASDGMGPVLPGAKSNPREAMIRAMISQLPEMHELGQTAFKALGKQPEIKQHVINGNLVESVPGQTPRVAGTYPASVDHWKEATRNGPDGKPIAGQENTSTGEFKAIGGQGQTINIGDKQDAALLAPALKTLEGARGTILTEQKNLDTAGRIYALSQDPELISGPGANALTTLSTVGAKLGLNGPDAAAKTQAMLTDLAGNALTRGQEMKGSFSDSDIKFLQDVTAGKIEATPTVMRDVAALAYATAHNSILAAATQYEGASNMTEQIKKASAMYPMPAILHKNLDPKLFTDQGGTGRMVYNSPLRPTTAATGAAPSAKGIVHWKDYLKQGGGK